MLVLHRASLPAAAAAEKFAELNPQQVEAATTLLPDQPAGFGAPITDRAAWDSDPIGKYFHGVIVAAEKLLTKDFPKWDDDLYLDFSRTGKRPPGEAMLRRREAWLYPLVIAECLENRGRFLPRIDSLLAEYAAEPTWTLPAHDRNLDCFHRKHYEVDLRASKFGQDLAQALYLLGDKVAPDSRQRVMAALQTRIFEPVRSSLVTGKGNFWLKAPMNWNPVCLSGVTGAALTVLPDRRDRGLFLATAEHYSTHYLKGFEDDGYCTEGLGYWAYGFGNFCQMREQILQSTRGRIDLFTDPKIRNVALFGLRIVMMDGASPAFGDCRFGTKPDESILRYCNRVLRLGVAQYAGRGNFHTTGLSAACMDAFPNSADAADASPATQAVSSAESGVGIRSYFDKAKVLICRPTPGTATRLAAAFKCGGNASHSHNDIGSYVIALDGQEPVGDPGGPVAYNNKTFGNERYTFKMLNSFGHPVPVVDGHLQRPATQVQPHVLSTTFTDAQDEFTIDLASAYPAPTLKKLVRNFRYDRTGSGEVVVEDTFEFSGPAPFEEGLPTRGTWRQTGAKALQFSIGHVTLAAEIVAPGDVELVSEDVNEDSTTFTRVGIRLKQPAERGVFRMIFRPETRVVPTAP